MFELIIVGIWDGRNIECHFAAILKINTEVRVRVDPKAKSLIVKYEETLNGKLQKHYECISEGEEIFIPKRQDCSEEGESAECYP